MTLNTKQGSNIKYGARVFTEQGVYMLATILKSVDNNTKRIDDPDHGNPGYFTLKTQ